MTPAIDLARRKGIVHTVHEYRHDPMAASYGLEAADALGNALGIRPERVFKTLVTDLGGRLAVAVLPVTHNLDLKALASAAGCKRADMADPKAAERATGYILGGISPLGQKKRLPLFLDASALDHDSIFVSAGRRGLEIELAASDLLALTDGKAVAIAR